MPGLTTQMRWYARAARIPASTRAAAKEWVVQVRMMNPSRRMKPSFFVIGAMKAGTTSLFNTLTLHPQIAEPVGKEIRYFDLHYDRGERWYRAHFPLDRQGEVGRTGEASPSYLYDSYAPGRMRVFAPDSSLIVILRNPVERAYSHYQHSVRYGREQRTFEEAIEQEEEWIGAEEQRRLHDGSFIGRRRIHHSYLARGRYLEQLQRWEAHFPQRQMLVLRSEDYSEQPAEVFSRTVAFLGLDEWRPATFSRLNAAQYERLDPLIRSRLQDYFEPHNLRLYEHLGRSMGWEETSPLPISEPRT